MAKKDSDLTSEAQDGYKKSVEVFDAVKNPYLKSSPKWFAFELGAYFQRTGKTAPKDVRMGRGYQIHASDMLFAFDARNAITRVE